MTVFGFLSTIVICATVIAIVLLCIKHPITKHIHHYSHTITEAKPASIHVPEETPQRVEAKQMDAVIAAVNELMGIATEDEANGSTQN